MGKKEISSVLYILRAGSSDNTAYTHRVLKLKEGLDKRGIRTGVYYIGDDPVTSHTMIPLYVFRVAKIMRQYDAVHAGASPSAHVAVLSKWLTRTRIYYDMHGDRIQEILQEISLGMKPWHSIFKTVIQNATATYGSHFYLPASGPLLQKLRRRGIPAKKITLVRNGVDLDLFQANPIKEHDTRIFTYAGKFQAYQAVSDFIDAAEQIQNPKIKFRIIGFGEEDREQKEAIRQRLQGRIELIDQVPQADLIRYLEESDVLVIPRRKSPVTKVALPTKFAEYIALSRPVLVANVDETEDFVRQSGCGVVYEEGADGLKKAILRMAEKSIAELNEMGKKGRQLAESVFSWDVIWKQYAKAYGIDEGK